MMDYQISKIYIEAQLRKADERRIAREAKAQKQEQWISRRDRRKN